MSATKPESFSREANQIIFEDKTPQALQEIADAQLKRLAAKEYVGILKEAIRWMPLENQSWNEYLIHLLQGEAKPEEKPNIHRTRALWLADGTIENPDIVIDQRNGRRSYMKMYSDEKNMLHQIIVELNEDERVGRIHTSFVTRDNKRHTNKAFKLMERQIREANRIVYIKDEKLRTRLTSGSTAQPASREDALLHQPGNKNISPATEMINSNTETASAEGCGHFHGLMSFLADIFSDA